MKILVQLIGNNICGPAVGSCWSVLFFLLITFTISNCVHISLLLTVAMKWGDTYFWCMMKMHAYAFLLKLKSICQIAFQGIHDVLAVSILPFSKRKNCFCVFLLLVSSNPITYPAQPFWCEVSVLLSTANCFLNSKYVHIDTSPSTVCYGNQSQYHSPELPVAVPELKAVYFQLAKRNHVCSQWEDSII